MRVATAGHLRLAAALIAFAACAGSLDAQAGSSIASDPDAGARWLEAWSPLAPVADLQRTAPGTPLFPGLISGPAPRVGLLWTAGNPAGLALDIADRRGEIRATIGSEGGAYRRPLDEDELSIRRISGYRWQPLGERSAVIGRVAAEEITSGLGAPTAAAARHVTDPFVLADTSRPGMRHVRVRMEGGYGTLLRSWSAGFAAGVELADIRTLDSRLPRLTRASLPGLNVGIGRSLGWGDLTVSAYGRWVGASETVRLISWPDPGVVLPLHGFEEPTPTSIGVDNPEFFRYSDREALAGGIALAGSAAGARWSAFGERHTREDEHYNDRRRRDAPRDRWEAEGWRVGGAVRRAVWKDRVQLVAFADYSALDGRAFRSDLAGRIIDARESTGVGGLDVRWAGGDWSLGAHYQLRRDSRLHEDHLAAAESDIASWMPAGAAEIARDVGSSTQISLGAATALYAPVARIPDPGSLGPVYRELVGPGLSFYSTRVMPMAGTAAIRREVGEGIDLVLRGRAERLEPADSDRLLPLVPEGSRTLWSLMLSAIWRQ